MEEKGAESNQTRGMGVFERYLTLWVLLCIVAGIALGKIAPGAATFLDGLAIYVDEAPVVSIPIALCPWCAITQPTITRPSGDSI